ncbi:MAG: 2-C-methyl-D-erythritol 4-phosphate cytidylyltransferase [Terriglobales bacterium]
MKVFVIIPAAGLGTRMASRLAGPQDTKGAPTSKQFAELGGVPILVHTLRKFASVDAVNEIFVALRAAESARFEQQLEQEGLRARVYRVEGGENRQQSVANALAELEKRSRPAADDVVLVHDAVRPFVDAEIIRNVIAAAAKHGAAIAGLPAVDTVKQVDRTADGAIVTSTVPRERVVLAQTPQGFLFAVLKQAFDDAQADGFTGTDEASLVERAGHEVAVVMGSARNIKITTPADLELAEFYLAQEKKILTADLRG